ncbi:PQQ-dependent sugar dehydrogenase [Endozoicomonas arenosclerae]|uniref:PQQ-dependent sugar dehydrogenase n=1 Tax=Endozoicomonas arenosclerae TaxID=1633495 RepID=UPI000782F0E3|nr:PQQ-dependent sugar dehydrogenase [Endozoicomonas arenosclerae]
MPSLCVGLVLNRSDSVPLKKPRKALELSEENALLVTDMGGWEKDRGSLWILTFDPKHPYSKLLNARRILTGLNLPHDIKYGPNGSIYLGEAHQISRLSLEKGSVSKQEIVVADLPYAEDGYLHPLTNMVFLANGDLLVNVGSRSDNCDVRKSSDECKELTETGLRLYRYQSDKHRWDQDYQVYATGLRNSMALAVHESGTILQAENSSDFPDHDEPYEEINIIEEGGFYGWPFCLNRQLDVADTGHCQSEVYIEPYSLMPPHVAPLDMIYYQGKRLPQLAGKLLVSWHGFRVAGNRLVSYEVDDKGRPILSDQPVFYRDPIPPATEWTTHPFNSEGGMKREAQHQEVISHWNKVPGVRPEGAPVGLLELKDGTLLIVDDKNKALLRLSEGQAYTEKQSFSVVSEKKSRQVAPELPLLKKYCAACHLELRTSPELLLNREGGWLRKEKGKSVLEQRLRARVRFMPPQGRLSESVQQAILGEAESM